MASAMEIGVKMRKMLIISIRVCHRSVSNHPFLVGVLGFLIFLYRSFPFLFSILVSASPVLVCTAVLLGTLLSFGQPNTPEIEEEEEVAHDISSFQTGLSEGATVIAEKDEGVVVKTHTESRGVVEERSIEEASLGEEKYRNVEESENLISFVPPVDESSQDFQNENQSHEQMDREICNFELENKKEVHDEKLKAKAVSSDDDAIEKEYVFVQNGKDDVIDDEHEETVAELLQTLKGDQLEFSPNSSWKPVDNNEEEDSLDSGSDRAESSSPDASMADIMPMLEELHPLLDLEASQTAQLSLDESAASEKSQNSDDGSVQSDEETENRVEVEEDGVDDHDDEEEEGGKEDDSKSAIKWTEDDQKNLMDLGTSELERNQRLENLIARRKARKILAEKNLIDFESSDLPFNVAPITTTRRNPFDQVDDSYAAMGLPPIPGSAPSNLQPRRNPFDIPYDPNEEKPDLKGDSFEQEFLTLNQKDAFFRRRESFSFRPSVLGATRQGKQNLSWKPIFVSEQLASEGTSYPSFQRQLSEVSETNLSSVQDTESVSSSDQDERKFDEQDLSHETELISNIDHASERVEIASLSSEEIDPVEMVQVHESNAHHDDLLHACEQVQADLLHAESEVQKDNLDDLSSGHRMAFQKSEKSHSSHNEYVEEGSLHFDDEEPARVDNGNTYEGVENADEKLELVDSYSLFKSSSYLSMSILQDLQPSQEAKQVSVVHPDLSSEENRLVEKNSLNKEDMFEVEQDKDGKLDLLASHSQHTSSNDLSVFVSHDLEPSLVAEQASSVHPIVTSVESEHVEEVFLKMEDMAEVEQDQLFLSNSFEQGNSDIHQDLDKAISPSLDCQNVQGEVKPPSILDNDLPTADNPSVAPSFSDHDESQKSCTVQVESTDTRDQALPQISSVPSDSFDTLGFKSPTDQMDSEVEWPGKVINEMQEIMNSSAEGYRSLDTEENIKESDELKEIDEGFLSELDTVGDFGFSGVAVSLHPDLLPEETTVTDAHVSSFPEDAANFDQEIPFLEARSVEDIDLVFKKFKGVDVEKVIQSSPVQDQHTGDGVESLHPDLLPEENTVEEAQVSSLLKDVAESGQEIPFLEAGSLEDIDLAFKQLKEGADVEKVIEPSSVHDQQTKDVAESLRPDLLLVENTVEDAQASSLPKDKIESGQEIPLVEARSLENIDSAFEQLKGADVKKVTLPSMEDQLSSEKSEEHIAANSDFRAVEAKSHDDADTRVEKTSESTQRELPKVLDMKDAPTDIEVKEVGPAKMTESCDVGSATDEPSKTSVVETEHAPTSSSDIHHRRSSSSSSSSSSSIDSN